MSFAVAWEYASEAVLLGHIPWPTSNDVAAGVHRFARERAPSLPTGEYRFMSAGYRVTARVDTKARTVLVLFLHRAR